MRRVIIVQARMTSTRLPGKILMDLAGRPLLEQQLRRLQRCGHADEIMVATTTNRDDDPIVDLVKKLGMSWFRGSENDVLSRYLGAARQARADLVVRITSDCPLIDPALTDHVIRSLCENASRYDYAANCLDRTYPRGLDTEAFFFDTLLRLDRMTLDPKLREHATYLILAKHPAFLALSLSDAGGNNADLRWTVDYPEDLELVRRLYGDLGLGERDVPYAEILGHVRAHPELATINQGRDTFTPKL